MEPCVITTLSVKVTTLFSISKDWLSETILIGLLVSSFNAKADKEVIINAVKSRILLDEPFAGVDPISVTDIKKIITDLRNRGLGVLITDHNVRETLDVCERAYIVGEGKIIATGTPEEVMNDEHVKRVYLGEQFKL